MDWSTFFTIIVQVLIGLAVLVVVLGVVVAAVRTIRGDEPRPPTRSWDGYYDESGRVPGKPSDESGDPR